MSLCKRGPQRIAFPFILNNLHGILWNIIMTVMQSDNRDTRKKVGERINASNRELHPQVLNKYSAMCSIKYWKTPILILLSLLMHRQRDAGSTFIDGAALFWVIISPIIPLCDQIYSALCDPHSYHLLHKSLSDIISI